MSLNRYAYIHKDVAGVTSFAAGIASFAAGTTKPGTPAAAEGAARLICVAAVTTFGTPAAASAHLPHTSTYLTPAAHTDTAAAPRHPSKLVTPAPPAPTSTSPVTAAASNGHSSKSFQYRGNIAECQRLQAYLFLTTKKISQ